MKAPAERGLQEQGRHFPGDRNKSPVVIACGSYIEHRREGLNATAGELWGDVSNQGRCAPVAYIFLNSFFVVPARGATLGLFQLLSLFLWIFPAKAAAGGLLLALMRALLAFSLLDFLPGAVVSIAPLLRCGRWSITGTPPSR